MNALYIKHRDSSSKMHVEHRKLNTVDFVLAYKRKQIVTEDDSKLHDETERQKFYQELRAHGISVNIDDDPTVSIHQNIVIFLLYNILNEN